MLLDRFTSAKFEVGSLVRNAQELQKEARKLNLFALIRFSG